MRYRSVIIGTGGRAPSHAEAYRGLESMALVAAADLEPSRRERFGVAFGVKSLYGDYRQMLAREQPDVVHLVTNPNFRVEPIQACAEQGVKAVIVEKPMGLSLADAASIEAASRRSGMKVIVNTQRRYFQSIMDLCGVLRSGQAGAIHCIRAHALSAVFCTGSHVLDMIQMMLGDLDPVHVWSAAYGADEYHSTHPGPHSFLTSITYPNRTQVLYEASKEGPGIHGTDVFFMATRFDVLTERGRLWWTEANGWGYQFEGMASPRTFATNFAEDDKTGQTRFTQAVADWLDDPAKPHGSRLETAARVFRIIAAMVQSATMNRRIEFAPASLADRAAELRKKLEAAEGVHPEKQGWNWTKPRA
jgi:predicted dehydrogenase